MKEILSTILIIFFTLIFAPKHGLAQNSSNNSLKLGFGVGINQGKPEIGIGTFASIGYQKSLWKERIRINPYLLSGSFLPLGITDTRDQYYRITSLGLNGYFDLIRIKPVSVFIGVGGFLNYSRGLLGTGGWPDENNNYSEYFFKLYYGGYLGCGLRIDPPNKNITLELTPINICFGNNYYQFTYLKIGIDLKLS